MMDIGSEMRLAAIESQVALIDGLLYGDDKRRGEERASLASNRMVLIEEHQRISRLLREKAAGPHDGTCGLCHRPSETRFHPSCEALASADS